ncbi:ComEA family DNA-binding protein [Haloechinothrix sp. LS1_15]|nr:ComEA family DNA-binding protein [Haloechinothrix sp. LS1_15]
MLVVLATAVTVVGVLGGTAWVLSDRAGHDPVAERPDAGWEATQADEPPATTGRGSETSPAGSGGEVAAGAAGSADPGRDTDELVVSVVGEVDNPGLVTVPPGARVAEAIEAAGGPTSGDDLLEVNLARRLSDGEQIHVGVPAPPHGHQQGPPGARPDDAARAPVDLNHAGQDQLEDLPGVGEVTAGRILEWRERHGPFTAVEQLREVSGIGERTLESLRERVTVG